MTGTWGLVVELLNFSDFHFGDCGEASLRRKFLSDRPRQKTGGPEVLRIEVSSEGFV